MDKAASSSDAEFLTNPTYQIDAALPLQLNYCCKTTLLDKSDIPHIATQIIALRSPYLSNTIHIHTDVELQHLRNRGIRHVEVSIIGEVVQSRKKCVIGVREILR